MAREPFEKVTIRIEHTIETCDECPKVVQSRTVGAGLAYDYTCSLLGRKIMGYVEYSVDENPVPEDCPLRVDKKKK